MVKIIETNLSISKSGAIKDHQSRIVEANSWEEYCKSFDMYDGNAIEFKSLTNMIGNTVPKEVKLYFLKHDDFHLSCNVWNGIFKTQKLAYLIDGSIKTDLAVC